MQYSYVIDWKRAFAVFDRLIARLRVKQHPFDHSTPPQIRQNMPDNLIFGGSEHAVFLWTVCYYMRGGIDSKVAVQQLTLIHERKPYLFVPGYLVKKIRNLALKNGEIPYGPKLIALLTKEKVYQELRSELQAHGLGFSHEENARFWILNAIKLHKFWQSDPRRLFDQVNSFDDLVDRIANSGKFKLSSPNGFLGFQHKMVSMITYFLAETNLVDRHTIPVPVDFHVLRMLLSNEIIKPNWNMQVGDNVFSPQLLSTAREAAQSYCEQSKIDMVELCDALWLFSRAMCSWHPDNESQTPDKSEKRKEQQKLRTNRKKQLGHKPRPEDGLALFENATKSPGRKSRVLHVAPTWGEAQLAAYDRSCRMCPVADSCKFAVPSAPYYLGGQLRLRYRSTPETDVLLFNLSEVPIKVPTSEWDKQAAKEQALQFIGKDGTNGVGSETEVMLI
ncbi:MAG: hypothetical protein PHF79_00445 [Candidatus Pacebacteria bacterium]|nr:hypothetical protein [Candidatus Paceibacterota bacterium]